VLTTRVEPTEIGFISCLKFNFEKIITTKPDKNKLENYLTLAQKYKYPIAIVSGIVIILFLVI
jgi:hypothetical protein